jgi:hypothetical protein
MKKTLVNDYVEERDNYSLIVDFRYYEDTGTWEQPPEEELEIIKVQYISEDTYGNTISVDITDLYYDHIDSDLYNNVLEYAKEQD